MPDTLYSAKRFSLCTLTRGSTTKHLRVTSPTKLARDVNRAGRAVAGRAAAIRADSHKQYPSTRAVACRLPHASGAKSHGRRGTHVLRAQNPVDRVQRQAESVKKDGTTLLDRLANVASLLQQQGTSPRDVALICGLVGITLGFAFQVTHNVGFLPAYDVWAFDVGPFPQSWTIPVLLAPIWLLYGYFGPILDEYIDDAPTAEARKRAENLPSVVWCWGLLALQFLFSDLVYQTGQPHWVCSVTLAAMAAAIWKAVDGTKQGAFLAALLTVGAPAGEMLIVNVLHLWHYDRPDIFGVPHWAGWCYATYALGVANVARYVVSRKRQ